MPPLATREDDPKLSLLSFLFLQPMLLPTLATSPAIRPIAVAYQMPPVYDEVHISLYVLLEIYRGICPENDPDCHKYGNDREEAFEASCDYSDYYDRDWCTGQ